MLARLRSALADRYRVERELGRGGMATVYLAHDLRHDRRVALKVLHPELAHALGPERFQREIRLAARLQHPHILTVHDSGEADGLLYYVMPFVDGESLRDRLRREKQLPVDEAIRIACEVAAALHHAHAQGIIHRDIKPENILLAGGHTLVADFGIARGLASDDDRAARLTETGMSVGTPAYMSPEQSSAERDIDGRTDIYSLACVLYEALVGATPFTGPSGQALMAQHAIDPVPPLRTRRPTVPPGVERAVIRALAKSPVDRFATAAQFSAALTAAPVLEPAPPRLQTARTARIVASGLALTLALVALLALFRKKALSGDSLDANVVAVAPFRVPASDPSLAYLREGMIDLLAAKLTGQAGPRAADPRTVLSAWRQASPSGEDLPQQGALAAAERLGAGQLLLGNVVAAEGRIVLNASLLAVPDGRETARTTVEGPADSLAGLVDRLAAGLLTLGAGEGEQRLASLTSTSLPALRSYLAGQALYRRGQFAEATRSFDRAVRADSAFALAAVGLLAAGLANASEAEPVSRGERLADASRDRLNPLDRAYLDVLKGLSNSATTSYADLLRQAERFAELAPDRAEAYVLLGEVRLAYGSMLGFTTARERAAAAYRKALELDSTFAPAYAGFLVTAASLGDTAAVRRGGHLYRAIDSSAGPPAWVRWRMAASLGDRTELERMRAGFDSLGGEHLMAIGQMSQYDGLPLTDAELAHAAWLRRESRGGWHQAALAEVVTLALNRGRPGAALAVRRQQQEAAPGSPRINASRLMDALYWDGDTAAAADAARELGDSIAAMAMDAPLRGLHSCALEQWRLAHGQLGSARRTIAQLRSAPQANAGLTMRHQGCAILLDALLAAAEQGPDAGSKLARLDSLMRTGPPYRGTNLPWNLVIARLSEARGDRAAALAAIRRRLYNVAEPLYLSSYLREEGRLAALAGDREGAIRAYRHYLALRSDPEPALRGQVEQVRGRLNALQH